MKKVAQSCLLGDQSSGSLWGLPITGDPTTIQKYIDAKIALESEGYQFEYIHYSTLVPGSKGYWVKVNPSISTNTPKAYWRDQDIFNIVTMEKIALMKNSIIIEFSLANYKLGDKYISHVSDILKSNICANLKVLDLKNNNLTDTSVMSISNNITTGKVPNLKVLNLADNNITDKGVGYLADSLVSKGNKLNVIRVEGNKFGPNGEKHFVKELLEKSVQHVIVTTQKLEKNSKLLPGVGTKDEKIAIYKEYIQKGVEKGTYDKGMVVDQSWLEAVKTQFKIVKGGVFGFVKCKWEVEDVITGYAQDKLIAKISKSLSKFIGTITNIDSTVSCYLEATDEMWTTNPGIKEIQHDLCVMGESEFCGE